MKKKVLLTAVVLAAGISSVMAQATGRIITAPHFDISQQVLFSQNDYVYGTSRSAAMGGAFTSLGANLSSMNINPAGLGMYQSSDWGITQSLSISSMNTTSPKMASDKFSAGGSRVSYGLDNVAMVFNSFNKSGALTSLSMGFGYNRMANFNSRSRVHTYGEGISIADLFAEQLNNMAKDPQYPIPPEKLNPSARPFENEDIFLREFGAVLGYQTGLVRYDTPSQEYRLGIAGNAVTDTYMQSVTKGGIYDYTFSLGVNVSNILYLGATLGASQIIYKDVLSYEETYDNGGASGFVSKMWYDQSTSITGTGFTMKLGAVLRPVSPLRIGVAFHLPTYYSIDKSYKSEMSVVSPSRSANSGTLEDKQMFNTAPRLLTGISLVIADRAILAVDYECAWFNKIHTRSTHMQEEEDSKTASGHLLKPQHSIRAGFEFLASDVMSVRLGGGYQTNIMKEKDLYDTNQDYYWPGNTPTTYGGYNLSAGLGFNVGRNAYIDITYMFRHSDYTKYDYYYLGIDPDNDEFIGQIDMVGTKPVPREYIQKKNNHMISLTIGSRF